MEELDEEERELTKAKNDAYEALQVCAYVHAFACAVRLCRCACVCAFACTVRLCRCVPVFARLRVL